MSKILRLNMSNQTAKFEDVPEKYKFLGGRGLTSSMTCDEVPPDCHPLGPNAKIFIAPGIVSGASGPSSGRLSVGGKSPLTGGIKEANAGGLASQKIAKLAIKAIALEGQAPAGKFFTVVINKDGVKFLPADDLVGKGMHEVDKVLWQKFPNKPAIIGIGPAGELRLTNAGVSVNDMENGPGRYAGRGGLGAVLGAMGLKAIVIDDKGGPGVTIADPETFKKEAKKLAEALLSHAVTSQGLPTYGTAILVNVMNEAGGLPTRNFTAGRFEGAAKVSGEMINEMVKLRGGAGRVGHACHPGCVMKCSNIYPRPDGTAHTSCLEYESAWSLGPNCGIDDMDVVAELVRICNDVGVDTIEAGVAIGVAMDGGLLSFGDGPGAIKLLSEIGKGTPLGRIIGSGAAFTAQAFGVTRVPVVKNQAMPAYDPRAVKGIGVTYATTTQGADHTAGYTIAPEILGVGGKQDPLAPTKGELSRAFQATTAFIDSTGYCLFIAFAILDVPTGYEGMVGSVNAMQGSNWTADDVIKVGLEIMKRERQFNEAAGFTNKDDRLPEFMRVEKLPPHNVVFDVPDEELDLVNKF